MIALSKESDVYCIRGSYSFMLQSKVLFIVLDFIWNSTTSAAALKLQASGDEMSSIDQMDLTSASTIKTARKCSSKQKHKEVKG